MEEERIGRGRKRRWREDGGCRPGGEREERSRRQRGRRRGRRFHSLVYIQVRTLSCFLS